MPQRKRKTSDDVEPTTEEEGASTAEMQQLQHHAYHPREGDDFYRTLYQTEPDFQQLAKLDSSFAAKLNNKKQLDFTDPSSVMQLTKTLLKLDFSLQLDLPNDRLCPPVPNRHNYILWIQRIMATTSYYPFDRPISGLDIGTGASCIYPLLACAQRQDWHFLATDIDDDSLKYARGNVERNHLQDRIKIMTRKQTDNLIPLSEEGCGMDELDFVMTNPPFYSSETDLLDSAAIKNRSPHSACTGAPVEMVCDGGEAAFVDRIFAESLRLRERVGWYTSMLGKAASVETVVEKLRKEKVDNYAVTEFVQGTKTRRWAVGWSFRPMRPEQEVARGIETPGWKKILPEISVEVVCLSGTSEIGKLGEKVDAAGQGLELLSWEWNKEKLTGIGRARENVWSRAWRRKKAREQKGEMQTNRQQGQSSTDERCVFGFRVWISVGRTEAKTTCRWVEGHDPAIFQSFCGFLKAQLEKPGSQEGGGR